jgi:hypothetical protein
MGEDEVTPDRVRISIGVQTQAATAADAAARNARLQRAVLDTVRALGIPAERITTQGYNVYPEQDFDPQTRRPRVRGYNVQNTIVVDLWDVSRAGAVLDAALAKGANNIGGLQFYSSQAEQSRRRALAQAVERARLDAEAMAAAAGGRLGSLLELSSEVGLRPRPMMEMDATMARGVAAPPPASITINPGTATTTASVSARWVLVVGR